MALLWFSIVVLFGTSSDHVFTCSSITDVALRLLEVYKSERDFSHKFIQIGFGVGVWEDDAYLFLLTFLIHDHHLFHLNWSIVF